MLEAQKWIEFLPDSIPCFMGKPINERLIRGIIFRRKMADYIEFISKSSVLVMFFHRFFHV